jgi:hypothetical protein
MDAMADVCDRLQAHVMAEIPATNGWGASPA